MSEFTLVFLFILLIFLLFFSAFFSGAETAITLANRNKIQALEKEKNYRGAKRVLRLMDNLEQVLSTILLGNNFVNILASALATLIAIRLLGEVGIAVSTILMTLVILIFAEITPKTFSTREPEKIAIIASFLLEPISKFIKPINKIIGYCVSFVLSMIGVKKNADIDKIGINEIRAILSHNNTRLSPNHQRMLFKIISAEDKKVKEIMIPRTRIQGIDLQDNFENIKQQIHHSVYNHLPVYDGDLSCPVGIVSVASLWKSPPNKIADIKKSMQDAYFIPENTSLLDQLSKFKKYRANSGLVVDEYGDIIGFLSLKLILDYMMDIDLDQHKIRQETLHVYVVDANCPIREITQDLGIVYQNIESSSTLNGMLIDYLGFIPANRLSVSIDKVIYEVIKTTKTGITLVKIDLSRSNYQKDELLQSQQD